MRVLKAEFIEVEPNIRMGDTLRLCVPCKLASPGRVPFKHLEQDENWQRTKIAGEETVGLRDHPGQIRLAFNQDGCLLWVQLAGFKTPMETYAPETKEPLPPYYLYPHRLAAIEEDRNAQVQEEINGR